MTNASMFIHLDINVSCLSRVTAIVGRLVCLPLDPKVAGSNLSKAMDF
jgi:hypothetical protein